MAFWSTTDVEPKRQFRFEVSFGNSGILTSDVMFMAQYADRPTYKIKGDTAIHYLDKQFMFPGKVTWSPVKIRFVDAVVGADNVAKKTWEYLENAGFKKPENLQTNNPTSKGTIGKANAVRKAGTVQVSVLDTVGNVIDKWTLNNAFVTDVAFNNLEYAQDGILTVEYTFTYDWANYGQ